MLTGEYSLVLDSQVPHRLEGTVLAVFLASELFTERRRGIGVASALFLVCSCVRLSLCEGDIIPFSASDTKPASHDGGFPRVPDSWSTNHRTFNSICLGIDDPPQTCPDP